MITEFNQIFLYDNFLGNSLKSYLIALIVFFLAIIFLKVCKKVLIAKAKKIADHTRIDLLDLIVKIVNFIGWPFYVIFSLYLSFQFLDLPGIVIKFTSFGLIIIAVYYLVKAGQEFIDYGAQKIIKSREEEEEGFDPSVIYILAKALKILLWVLAIIIILQGLGYNVTALVAGLGIGGVAVAFALQGVLSDVFASFSIYFDRPFKIGDFIIVGDDMGTVKNIGIKSTRLQTLQGEELVISNKELTEARIHNYKKMEKRRIAFTFGVLYETPTEKLKKIPLMIKEIIDKSESAKLDRVHFKTFGDFSLNFEVVYYLNTSDYNQYMDTQQKVNLSIKERFEKEGIGFAYPTQKIFLDK